MVLAVILVINLVGFILLARNVSLPVFLGIALTQFSTLIFVIVIRNG